MKLASIGNIVKVRLFGIYKVLSVSEEFEALRAAIKTSELVYSLAEVVSPVTIVP
jgi:hypothetical protein